MDSAICAFLSAAAAAAAAACSASSPRLVASAARYLAGTDNLHLIFVSAYLYTPALGLCCVSSSFHYKTNTHAFTAGSGTKQTKSEPQ